MAERKAGCVVKREEGGIMSCEMSGVEIKKTVEFV